MRPFASAIYLIGAVLLLAACSSDDAPDYTEGSADNGFLSAIASGKTSASFQMDDYAFMHKSSTTEEWSEVNLSEYDGWELPLPARIVFQKGELLTPVSLFHISTGPHILYLPFEAYKIATGFSEYIYVANPLAYDNSTGVLTIGGGCYSVSSASREAMVIEQTDKIRSGGKWTLSYAGSDFQTGTVNAKNIYRTEGEACLGIVGMIRATFGDTFDMNTYLAREGMRSSNPIVNLDELEATVRAMYGL